MELEIKYLMPIFAISFFAVFSIVFDALFNNKKFSFWFAITGLLSVIGLSVYTLFLPKDVLIDLSPMQLLTKNMVSFGGFASFMDILFAFGGLIALLASRQYISREYKELNEYYSLFLIAISGMMLIAHSNHLLILFIGIEIMSITFYVLAGYFRTSIKSIEAALKYFLLGSFATGFLVYGIAMVYGSTGSMDLTIVHKNLVAGQFNGTYLLFGIGLLIIGLSFKVAAFPFHQWAPDVYNGAPTIVTGFMSSAGKAAALTAFIIVANTLIFSNASNELLMKYSTMFQSIMAAIAACTMIIGNITALVQTNVKRMLAYSSVAHAGYLLMGIVANSSLGWTGIIFYSLAYILMQSGAFVILSIFEKNEQSNLEIKNFAGLSKTHPVLAAMMSIFMLSLAGIPPFAGFFGKYYLFVAAVNSGFTWLTIIAVIASIVSMYYYIGLILSMYFKENEADEMTGTTGLAAISIFIAIGGLLLFGLFPSLITEITKAFF